MQISLYKNSKDNRGGIADLTTVLRNIKQGVYRHAVAALREMEKAEYDEQKKLILPAVTFSGTFDPTRHDSNIRDYTGLMTLDIDHCGDRMDDIYDAIASDPFTYCLFTSPSGDGLKVLVPVDSDKKSHVQAFECIRLYYKNNYDVDLDPSGKNIARLCYVSSCPDLFFNGNARRFHVELEEGTIKRIYGDRSIAFKGFGATKDDDVKYGVCKMWAAYHHPYEEGSRNNHIHTCACNLNRVGVSESNAILLIARDRVDIPTQEIVDTVGKVYKSKVGEHKTQTVYEFEKQQDLQRGVLEFDTPARMIERITSMQRNNMVSTGHPKRDSIFGGGFLPGSVYAYIGRDKTFKSIDAIWMASVNALAGKTVLYMNGEMSLLQFMQIIAQQQMNIRRRDFDTKLEEIKLHFGERFNKLCIVTNTAFTKESVIKTAKSAEMETGQSPSLIIYDGLKQMAAKNRETILSMIENAEVAKEVAKACNAAVIVLIHTDANCQYWNRNPRDFVLGKTQVTRNFDGSVGFSRFVIDGSMSSDGRDYELRTDLYHVKLQDDRFTGEVDNIVMKLGPNVQPEESDDQPGMYEIN